MDSEIEILLLKPAEEYHYLIPVESGLNDLVVTTYSNLTIRPLNCQKDPEANSNTNLIGLCYNDGESTVLVMKGEGYRLFTLANF